MKSFSVNSRTVKVGQAVWRVGFSGHRRVTDESRLVQELNGLWTVLAGKVSGTLEAATGLAEGGDLLFAESALRAGIPLQLRFPYPVERFREEIGEASRERFDWVVSGAAALDATEPVGDRNAAYYAGGIDVLDQADMMVFFWDGEGERGHGGTAQIVRAARTRRTPSVFIHAKTFAVSYEHFPEGQFEDRVSATIAPVMRDSGLGKRISAAPDGPASLFALLDRVASESAPRYRFIAAHNIVVHVVAIIVGVLALAYVNGFWAASSGYLKTALIVSTLALYFYARHRQFHQRWLTCRTGAELSRALLATASILSPRQREMLFESFPEYRRVLRPLASAPCPRDADSGFLKYRDDYIEQRIEEQGRYFERSAAKLNKHKKILGRAFLFFSLGGLACALSYLAVGWGVLKLLVVVMPLLSMMVLSLNGALDLDRRLGRFCDMAEATKLAADRLRGIEDAAVLRREVLRQERQLLQEVAEWAQQTRHLHIH